MKNHWNFKILTLLALAGMIVGCANEGSFRNTQSLENENIFDETMNSNLAPTVTLSKTYFTQEILPMLSAKMINDKVKGCTMCHDNPAPTYEAALKLVIPGNVQESILFKNATGANGSGHRVVWKGDTPETLKLIAWISGKAQ